MNAPVFVVDLGGTWLRSAVFDPAHNRLSHRERQPTPPEPAVCRTAIFSAWTRCGRLPLIGISAAPTLGPDGIICAWSNRPAYVGQRIFPEPMVAGGRMAVLDDGTAAAVSAGAAWAGGRSGIVLSLTVGTGIGGGAMIDGRPLIGRQGAAMNIGHIKVPAAAGRRCSCGEDGCVQAVASGRAIAAAVSTGAKENPALDLAAEALQALVSILLRTFDPEHIALCGGLGLGGLRSRMLAPGSGGSLVIHPDGEDAGLIGAGMAATFRARELTLQP